jgi:hypothetical protein
MKAYEHLIQRALAAGFLISVDGGGDELDLVRSMDYAAIIEAVEAVDEAVLFIGNGKRFATVLVSAFGLADDETVIDYAGAHATATQWLDDWFEDYQFEIDHGVQPCSTI